MVFFINIYVSLWKNIGSYHTCSFFPNKDYLDYFLYIKYYLDRLTKCNKKYKFKTLATDFEIALFRSFNIIFNWDNDIRHVGKYIHYLQNIPKLIQKTSLTTLIILSTYDKTLDICKELPFKKLTGDKLDEYIKNYIKEYKNNLEKFYIYFDTFWRPYFNNDSLLLDEIMIKFRINNCLENFSIKFSFTLYKFFVDIVVDYSNMIEYVDYIIEEVIDHEEFFIKEAKNL